MQFFDAYLEEEYATRFPLLCEQGDDGIYTADFYKSTWLTVEGTGEVLIASTCGSAVDAQVTIYSSCLNTPGCISTLDEEDPYSYEEFCQDRCVATSYSPCADGSGGSLVIWQSTAGHVYHLQVWQNRRSWGLCHQRFYFPLPCDGEAVLKVTSSSQELGSLSTFPCLTPQTCVSWRATGAIAVRIGRECCAGVEPSSHRQRCLHPHYVAGVSVTRSFRCWRSSCYR